MVAREQPPGTATRSAAKKASNAPITRSAAKKAAPSSRVAGMDDGELESFDDASGTGVVRILGKNKTVRFDLAEVEVLNNQFVYWAKGRPVKVDVSDEAVTKVEAC